MRVLSYGCETTKVNMKKIMFMEVTICRLLNITNSSEKNPSNYCKIDEFRVCRSYCSGQFGAQENSIVSRYKCIIQIGPKFQRKKKDLCALFPFKKAKILIPLADLFYLNSENVSKQVKYPYLEYIYLFLYTDLMLFHSFLMFKLYWTKNRAEFEVYYFTSIVYSRFSPKFK